MFMINVALYYCLQYVVMFSDVLRMRCYWHVKIIDIAYPNIT